MSTDSRFFLDLPYSQMKHYLLSVLTPQRMEGQSLLLIPDLTLPQALWIPHHVRVLNCEQ
ncbi:MULTISPECIES: hypothetical protein [Nostocales]|uniref:Uncharacterized protein n=3 Tax=Nostocales TaxID=1161 RepID=A0A8S9TE41_9CYAN|nr:hypothetical protein [Tolypothrix bouteillei]KAF3889573.1 hypothetical protein DA73_0400031960 [Tolypothrix bouteillei VB521301]